MSCSLDNVSDVGLIIPSIPQYCSSTHIKAAAQPSCTWVGAGADCDGILSDWTENYYIKLRFIQT